MKTIWTVTYVYYGGVAVQTDIYTNEDDAIHAADMIAQVEWNAQPGTRTGNDMTSGEPESLFVTSHSINCKA